jgi:hypothetical protein
VESSRLRPQARTPSPWDFKGAALGYNGSPQEFVKTFKYRLFSEMAFLDTLDS